MLALSLRLKDSNFREEGGERREGEREREREGRKVGKKKGAV